MEWNTLLGEIMGKMDHKRNNVSITYYNYKLVYT